MEYRNIVIVVSFCNLEQRYTRITIVLLEFFIFLSIEEHGSAKMRIHERRGSGKEGARKVSFN